MFEDLLVFIACNVIAKALGKHGELIIMLMMILSDECGSIPMDGQKVVLMKINHIIVGKYVGEN